MHTQAILTFFLLAAGSGGPATTDEPTPAEARIERARRSIEADPGRFQAYNELAWGLARRARETADPSYYEGAGKAVAKSFELAPRNFEARKIDVWLLLGQHEFAQALEKARALNREVPDDVQTYGFLVDAAVELGDYELAEESAQWMLDLRPGNVPGLTRAAYLRELFGDVPGAIDLMTAAYPRVDPEEREDRAWILTHVAHLRLSTGDVDGASRFVEAALELFPDYHYALAQKAAVSAARGELAEAAETLRRRHEVAPHPENLFELAAMLRRAGEEAEADELFARFEHEALAESEGLDNANRELVWYYADHADRPGRALDLAATERERRGDVRTRAAYAWALHRDGRHELAHEEMEAALAVGIRDADLFRRAGVIALSAGETATATARLEAALDLQPFAPFAEDARRLLEERGTSR